ncbi:MAG: carboxypeptidase regulatory-like domain-containing protein [Spirochaetaceae bacterium]|nr:carboxypeptidase regulatory-like domain-containing protein [Spirochaetaceae bacterium]
MKKIYLVLFVILSIFVFSCKDNLISSDLSSSQNSGAGQVKVFVKQSRLIGPDVSDVDWTVELYKGNDEFSGKNEKGYYLFSGLSDGTYNITVSGKTGEVEKFTGSAQVTITNGNSVSVNVPIVATKNPNAEIPSTGYATITMDMSEELLSKMGVKFFLHAELVGSDDKVYIASFVDEENQIFLDNQQITFAYTDYSSQIPTTDIPAGYYNLSFVGLEDFGYSIKLKDNLVEIGDGLTTNIVLTQKDYELVQGNSYSQGMSTVFYIDNEDGNHTRNENGGIDAYAGTSLSNPLGFRNIDSNISGTFYLITDVEAYKEDDESSISYISGKTITSFGTDIFSIINNNENFSLKFERTFLKNINLTNTTSNGFSLLQCPIDGTVILDTPIVQDSNTDSTVLMSKSSNLEIGQNFSGELGICLSSENWQLGDTVVTFENGKPDNANFYISESYDSQGNSLASKFYIDDNGKLAQYDASSQWVNFAWNDECPYLITQTQAKNKTYTSIYDSNWYLLNGFNGISTYDGNRTWYFIANGSDANGNIVPSLYKVSAPTEYTGSVTPEKIEVDGNLFNDVQSMAFDDGKLYFGYYFNSGYNFYSYDVSKKILTTINWLSIPMTNANSSDLTSFMVKGNDFYFATTFKDTNQPAQVVTHSAIWKYTLSEDISDYGVYYNLIPAETYVSEEVEYPVPYYMTVSDENLVGEDTYTENSTFRITDLYIDGTEVYGLLANYGSVTEESSYNLADNIHLRGSIFKLGVNSDDAIGAPKMTATHSYLRDTLVVSGNYKQDFILPRKIVGIYNKKLFIADDGLIPDGSHNLNRFSVFDLDTAVSEFIEVSFDFSVSSASSSPLTVSGSIYENIFN